MTDEVIAADQRAPEGFTVDDLELMIPVDPEPGELRFAVFGVFVVATIISYIVIGNLTVAGLCSPLSLFGGFALGAGSMYLAEKLLKPRWSSNRFVHLRPDAIRMLSKGSARRVIDPTLQVNVLKWHFRVKRRTRVPKGWYVLAMALEQDDTYLPLYSLVSPDEVESLVNTRSFPLLVSRRDLSKLHEESSLRRAGIQRRLHTAEFARNVDGVEMLPQDFAACIRWLEHHFPNWMPQD